MNSIINLRITHKSAPLPVLETLRSKDLKTVYKQILSTGLVTECVLLQTCNRVEIFAVVPAGKRLEAEAFLMEKWAETTQASSLSLQGCMERAYDYEALEHLVRLSAGLESMIVGEDQILGQVRSAFKDAEENDVLGSTLNLGFSKALKIGAKVRTITGINKGAVSIGSAAVALAEEISGSIQEKKVLLIGTGEAAQLVVKALRKRLPQTLWVASRTFERAVRFAGVFGGESVPLESLAEKLQAADIVFAATSCPKYLLTYEMVREAASHRVDRRLLLVDLSNPRNVDPKVSEIPHVQLRIIDNLKEIAKANLDKRRTEALEAEKIIRQELEALRKSMNRMKVEPLISLLWSRAENTRKKEVARALRKLKKFSDEDLKTIDDLTRGIVEAVLDEPVSKIRRAAERGDDTIVDNARQLFSLKATSREESSM